MEQNQEPQVEPQTEPEQQDPVTEKKTTSGSSFYKEKLTQVQQENERLLKSIEDVKTQQLAEKENFKELWELEKQKREQAEQKATSITESYFNGLKMSAIEQEALKSGIRSEALEDLSLLDNGLVQIETTSTGNANVLGAKEFIESIKERKPFWFKNQNAPNINNASPDAPLPQKAMTPGELLKLQKENPVEYKTYMKKTYGLN